MLAYYSYKILIRKDFIKGSKKKNKKDFMETSMTFEVLLTSINKITLLLYKISIR